MNSEVDLNFFMQITEHIKQVLAVIVDQYFMYNQETKDNDNVVANGL